MTRDWPLVCSLCGASAESPEATTCSRCHAALRVRLGRQPETISEPSAPGLWRYRAWLPFGAADHPVTLGEGSTPLLGIERWARSLGLEAVFAKLEYAGPTGSFKDRGASVLVSHVLATGVRRIAEDSSGNAGASMAAYAARAGLECEIFAPATAPAAKLRQIEAYGAMLTPVQGSRERVAEAAIAAGTREGIYYAGHNTNPFFVEGTKTLAFELAEAFGPNGPEHVIMPVGGGSLFCGTDLGFQQLLAAGFIRSMPRLHLAQADGCMPLVAAFQVGARQPLSVERRRTVAGGIEIERPARGSWILRILRETGGAAVSVTDAELLQSQRDLARLEGVLMEPTSAAAFAALAHLVADARILPHERVVVVVTGSGLKDQENLPA